MTHIPPTIHKNALRGRPVNRPAITFALAAPAFREALTDAAQASLAKRAEQQKARAGEKGSKP